MSKMKKWLYILLLFVIVIALAGMYVFKEYNRKHEDTAELKASYTVSAADIIKDFETAQELAAKKYNDKIIMTSGFIKDILKDARGFYLIMLGDTTSMSSVKCSMDSVHNSEAATLQKGTFTTVKGVCAGFNADELLGSDVILVRCMIDKAKK